MPALVVEGGANRASYATGAAAALQAAGFVPDAVYGTSAGGAIAAWYGAGQMELAVASWEAVTDRRLLSYRRALRGGHVLDLRTLYRHYYPRVFGFDVARLQAAPFPVHVTIADADTGETLHPDIRRAEDPLALVHCGAAIPIFAECPIEHEGRRYLDGGATDPIPLARALADGHRDVVLLLNRPPGERAPEPEWVTSMLGRRFPQLAQAFKEHHELHNRAAALATNPPEGVRVRVVRPETDTGVSRTTRDVGLIRGAIERGRRDGARMAAELGLTHVAPRRVPVAEPQPARLP
jgi:predicted patatin/cPLA2 family phospholipase